LRDRYYPGLSRWTYIITKLFKYEKGKQVENWKSWKYKRDLA
jgi:hypothetical protein